MMILSNFENIQKEYANSQVETKTNNSRFHHQSRSKSIVFSPKLLPSRMAKENFKIIIQLCLPAYILIAVSAQDIIENDLSRTFSFAAVVNTSSSLDSEDQVLARHKARSAVGCAHKCLTNKQCQVIGFNAKSGVCWLMKSANRNGVLMKSEENLVLIKVELFDRAPEEKVAEFSSCKEVMDKGKSKGNGIYNLKTNQTSPTKTYCHMDKITNCGSGGWTLTMKIDGSKDTFDSKSSYWTNRRALKAEEGLGLEDRESKLPTYWSTPLTKICLGMKRNNTTNWLKLELQKRAASLHDVISTGHPAYTFLGLDKWKHTFIPHIIRSQRVKTPLEGVDISLKDPNNDQARVKLGVLYRVQYFSVTYLTYLGFGTWGDWHQERKIDVSCGYGREYHKAPYYLKNPAFCYILVQ